MNKGEKWVVEADESQENWSDKHPGNIARNFEYLAVCDERKEIGMRRSGQVMDRKSVDMRDVGSFQSADRMENEGVMRLKSDYRYENLTSRRRGMNEFDNVEYNYGDDGAEYFKLMEVKDQSNHVNNGKEVVSLERRMARQEPYVSENFNADASLGMNRASMEYSSPKSQFRGRNSQNQHVDPLLSVHTQETGSNRFRPPQYTGSHAQGFEDPLMSQMPRRNPYNDSPPYQHQQSNAYTRGRYVNDGSIYVDRTDSKPGNVIRHHPSCSCFQCHKKREILPSVKPFVKSDKLSDDSNHMMFNSHDNRSSFGPHEHNEGMSYSPSARSRDPHLRTRWPNDVNSQPDGFARRHPHRMHFASRRQHCRPVAGCAPFFICYNCFELLQLSRKVLDQNSDRKKMKCGGCFTVIVFAVSSKELVVLNDDSEAMDISAKAENNPVLISTHGDGHLIQDRATFSANNNYDDSGNEFKYMDRELGQLSAGQGKNNSSTNSGKHHFASTYGLEASEDSENLTAARKDSSSVYLSPEDKGNPTPAGSPGNKLLPDKVFATQISTTDLTSATEIDMKSYEYTNTTFISGGGSRNHERVGGVASFSASADDNTFRDASGSKQTLEPEKANVTINGYPVLDRLIRKAENLAGPIEPGHYWYDFRAGFWGVMGGSCSGIIPPSIAEFNYLMPDKCSSGNTSVFVNGRELSQKDLNLLGQRGLPPDRDRSYIIEISGKVLDADTGSELQGLGKLASSVEKAKKGFGMRDPNAAAQATNF